MSNKSKFLKSAIFAIASAALVSGASSCKMMEKHSCANKSENAKEKHSCKSAKGDDKAVKANKKAKSKKKVEATTPASN